MISVCSFVDAFQSFRYNKFICVSTGREEFEAKRYQSFGNRKQKGKRAG